VREERKIERKRKNEEFQGRRGSSLKKLKRESRLVLRAWLLGVRGKEEESMFTY